MGSQLINAVDAAYPAMAEVYAADWAAVEAANEGLYVYSGCAVSASGTAGKVDMTAGTIFATTTITSLADATNPKWVGLEIDSSGVLQFNAGTAAALPVKPALTASRVPVAWLYVPANATAVDALLSTANGKAKIIDARIVTAVHPARLLASDTAETQLTNPTALTTILGALIPIPANSINIGDILKIRASGRYVNSQNTDQLHFQVLVGGGVSCFDHTTVTAPSSASGRVFYLDIEIQFTAIGASAKFSTSAKFSLSTAALDSVDFDSAVQAASQVAHVTNALRNIDFKVNLTPTSSSTALFQLFHFTVIKIPA